MRVATVASAMSFALLLASSSRAAPASRGARITWVRGVAADRCVGLIGLEEDVKARLGYDPFVLPSELSVEGAVVRAEPGFRAELVIRDGAGHTLGTRQLTSREADCRSLGEAVAVAITVAIDPEAAGSRPSLVEETPFSPAGAPAAPLQPSPALEPPAARGHATVAGGASAGILPGIAPVVSLHARIAVDRGARGEVGMGAHFWPESREGGLGFGLTSVALEGCVVPWGGARVLRWCGAVHVGAFQVFVHAADLAPVEVGMFPWAAAETGPAISIPLAGPWRLEATVSALVPIVRRQAFLRGQPTPVWEQSAFGGSAQVGVGASL